MMNAVMTSACFGVLLVGANARSMVGEYGGYGDELGMYGEYGAYGDMFGAYGGDGDDIMPSPGSDLSEDDPSKTCENGACEMGDDVDDDEADEMVDFDDADDDDDADDADDTADIDVTDEADEADDEEEPVVPEPLADARPPRTTPTNPVTVPNPTTETNSPTPSVPTPPSTPDVNTETTRATPPVDPVQENAAVALSGSFLFALIAVAAGGAMLL